MLPPIEDAVLQNNPKFAALYSNLATNILTPSGSTKSRAAQHDRDATTEALKAAQFRTTKSHFLKDALSSLDLSSSSSTSSAKSSKTQQQTPLPEDLVQIIILISARLSCSNIPPSSIALLESTEPYTALHEHLPAISNLVSQYLQAQALAIARIVSPTTNSSFIHRTIPKLSQNIRSQQESISAQKLELARRRNALVGKASLVLSLYQAAAEATIESLEQVKHGVVARNARARADFLSTSARLEEHNTKNLELSARKTIYSDEVNHALQNYMEHLKDARERLAQRQKIAERELWGYGVGRETGDKEKVMKEIARVYGELSKEINDVSRDVEKLKGK